MSTWMLGRLDAGEFYVRGTRTGRTAWGVGIVYPMLDGGWSCRWPGSDDSDEAAPVFANRAKAGKWLLDRALRARGLA